MDPVGRQRFPLLGFAMSLMTLFCLIALDIIELLDLSSKGERITYPGGITVQVPGHYNGTV